MNVDPQIQEPARRVAERFSPEKIILFGSHATGHADAGSDVDLLVVMDCPCRPVEQAVAIRSYLEYWQPMDLLVRTPQELERRLKLGDWFLREVVEQGIVLYERSRPCLP
jgi:predicted nucleotidyltransferase